MELDQAIAGRRRVRKFSDQVVSDEEISALIEAARQAPSWANTQVWEFIAVRDRGLIERVVGTFAEKNPATKGSLGASVLIVACAKTGISGCYEGKDVTSLSNWYMFDLGMAVQNLCLKAHDMGLGTVVVGLMDHRACKKILGVPEDREVVAVIPVGRPADPGKSGPPRKELAEILYRDTFGTAF